MFVCHILTKSGTKMRPYITLHKISRQSDNLFPLHGNFHTLTKRSKKTRKNEETIPIFENLYLRNPGTIYLKFGMCGTEGREHLDSSWFRTSSTQLRIRKNCIYCSSCQYTHGCGALVSWGARHTTVCLDYGPTYAACCITIRIV